ncbi:tagC [Symbiodinium microadriaticum]|nr:tagC [Symbiodinium microadriaticum]
MQHYNCYRFSLGWFITGAKSEYPVRSSQHCSSSASMGTSFSCPLLAGHVALAREYFRTGYYPSGYRNVADGFEPSGALLKAVLIHGAERLKQVQLSDGGIESTGIDRGDNNQGYGRSQLNNVLSFNVNATLEGLTFFAVGAAYNTGGPYAEMKASDSPHEYKFTTGSASNLKPIRITLAYTDYYAVAGAANVMINDLDLMMTDGTDTYYPVITNLDGKYDRLNNVEAIILFNPPANTTFTVTVTGHSISTTQPYALIISGEVGQFPYSKDDSNWLLYILGALLILIFGGCCVLTISACISKKKAIDKKKPHAVAQDPNTPDVMHQSSRGDV